MGDNYFLNLCVVSRSAHNWEYYYTGNVFTCSSNTWISCIHDVEVEVCWRTECSTHFVYLAPFSPQIVVARLDGTLEFLNLGVPIRPAAHSPLQENSPIKRSSPRVMRKTTDASSSNTSVGIKGTRANISMDSPQCRINHKLRAHHQPISVLDVMDGRVITGSHDRTLKVNSPFAFFCRFLDFWSVASRIWGNQQRVQPVRCGRLVGELVFIRHRSHKHRISRGLKYNMGEMS